MKPVQNPPASVWEYEVDGDYYYKFSGECCDGVSTLFDSNCEEICHPDGGITGTGSGDCPEWQNQVEVSLIWEDSRRR